MSGICTKDRDANLLQDLKEFFESEKKKKEKKEKNRQK